MQFGQALRSTGAGIKRGFARLFSAFGRIDPELAGRWAKRAGMGLLVLVLLYYPVGMLIVHRIDDDRSFGPSAADLKPGQSLAVAMLSALVDREVNQHRWVPNDPFFMPAALLDNMPNYQLGMMGALARFGNELRDQLGRTRGSSRADEDLQAAAGLLQYDGTQWIWDPTVSLIPTASSEAQYLKALRSLESYSARLATGDAVYELRSDNLLATLDRIALDIGSSSAALENRVKIGSGQLIDTAADDVFYRVKGQMYAYFMILRALKTDFASVIETRDLTGAYDQMLDSFEETVRLDPWVVVNGAPDGQFMPSHLAAQGFYILRARTQLREITNILQT